MSITNTTTLNDLIGQIVSEQALSYAYSARVMRPLVSSYPIPEGAGSITVPIFTEVGEASLTEGTAPTASGISTDGVVLTPSERGILARISKSALHADPFTDLEPYGQQLGKALAQGEDYQILNVMGSGVWDDTAGTTATDFDLAAFRNAISDLEKNNAPKPYSAVMHPATWSKLVADLDDASAFSTVGQTIVEGHAEGYPSLAGYVASPYGIPTFISTQVPSNDTDYYGCMFSKEAVGFGFIKDITVDVDDNITARAYDLMAWRSADQSLLVSSYGTSLIDGK